ncbi:hypothetical protein GQ53DRAFT_837564 [Thozetella sp. PMI_491]|nr:hypothetical protein GQ53DRAFT_837564 [Thozetella sp. PMI_491]
MSNRGAGDAGPEASGSAEVDPPREPLTGLESRQNAGERVLEKARGDLIAAIDSGTLRLRRPDSSLTVGSRRSGLSEVGSFVSSTSSRLSSASSRSYASSIFSLTSSRLSRASSTFSFSSWKNRTDVADTPDSPSIPGRATLPQSLPPRKPQRIAPRVTYLCTICDEQFTLGDKEKWKRHELEDHPSPNALMCPKPGCCQVFWDVDSFRVHHNSAHRCKDCQHSNEQLQVLGRRKHWACGFCSTSSNVCHTPDLQLEHIAAHFERGQTMKDWSHSNVIRGLLRLSQYQPYLSWLGPGFLEGRMWDKNATGRSNLFVHYSRPGNLQDMLEHFSGSAGDADRMFDLAIDLSRPVASTQGLSETFQKYRSKKLPLLPSNRDVVEIIGPALPRNSTSSSDDATPSRAAAPSKQKVSPSQPPSMTSQPRSSSSARPRSSMSEKSEFSVIRPLPIHNGSQAWKRGSMLIRNDLHGLPVESLDGHSIKEEACDSPSSSSESNLGAPTRVQQDDLALEPPKPSLLRKDYYDLDAASENETHSETSFDDVPSSAGDESPEMPGPALVSQALNDTLEAMIDRVMEEFWVTWHQEWNFSTRQCGNGSESSGGGAQPGHCATDTPANPSGGRQPQKGKRRRSDGSGNDDNDGSSPPPEPPVSKPDSSNNRKFACPFRKHDPITYSLSARRVCAVSGWESTARVKEHLYRCHIPIYCDRCKKVFKDKDGLKEHLVVDKKDICEIDPRPPPEGITPNQLSQLRSRKRTARIRSEEDKWCNIYNLLFPNEGIPSPYFEPIEEVGRMSPESRELEEFEGYLRNQVPRLVRDSLIEAARQEMNPVEEHLLRILHRVTQDSIELASRQFREARGDETQPPPSLLSTPVSSHPATEPSQQDSAPPASVTALAPGTPADMATIEEAATEAVALPSGFLENLYSSPPALDGQGWREFDISHFLESSFAADFSDSGYASAHHVCTCGGEPCTCAGPCV